MSEPESKKLEERLEQGISAAKSDPARHWSASLVEIVLEDCLTALREKDEEIARLKAQVADLLRSIPESDK